MKQQNLNSGKIELELNVAEFLTEYFDGNSGFSYGSFWQAVNNDTISVYTDRKPKNDSSFYYEYGLLKAEEEMEAEHIITETCQDDTWRYYINYINAEEPQVSYFFYTKTRIMAFIEHENETLRIAQEMLDITQQKPVLCLECHTYLFRGALDCILEAYSKDYYSEEDLQREFCPDNTEIASWMQYEFKSNKYAVECAIGDNVGNAIDAAWTWFRTGYVNNFISLNPHNKEIHLNW